MFKLRPFDSGGFYSQGLRYPYFELLGFSSRNVLLGLCRLFKPGGFESLKQFSSLEYGFPFPEIFSPLHPYLGPVSSIIQA